MTLEERFDLMSNGMFEEFAKHYPTASPAFRRNCLKFMNQELTAFTTELRKRAKTLVVTQDQNIFINLLDDEIDDLLQKWREGKK